MFVKKSKQKIQVNTSDNLSKIKVLLPPLKRAQKPPIYSKFGRTIGSKTGSPKKKNHLPQPVQYVQIQSLIVNNNLPSKHNSTTSNPTPNCLSTVILQSTSPILYMKNNLTGVMLPSMPMLCTPVKVNAPDNSNETNNVENKSKTDLEDENHQKDDEVEINALMKASSTTGKLKPKISAYEKKKAKQQKELETAVALLSPEHPKIFEEKAKNYAQAYISKVQERLNSNTNSAEDYNLFLATLSDHDESMDTVTDLYSKVTAILSPKHADLCEEFITFLTPAQARQIEKLIPHCLYSKMATFLRKLETYYSKQPAQIRKVYNSLIELSSQQSVTMDVVKSTILPLLKGNNLLTDYFLQIFPLEKPPESLMNVWEEIDSDSIGNKHLETENSQNFESINIPDVVDPYGSSNCICSCHNSSDEDYALRNKHCTPCGTKFIQGKVFIQTGKGPRPATVSFPGTSVEEQTKRLMPSSHLPVKRRSDTASPVKNLLMSPIKHCHNNESDDENIAQNKTLLKHSPKNPRLIKSPKSITANRKLTQFTNATTTNKSEVMKCQKTKSELKFAPDIIKSPKTSSPSVSNDLQKTIESKVEDSDQKRQLHNDTKKSFLKDCSSPPPTVLKLETSSLNDTNQVDVQDQCPVDLEDCNNSVGSVELKLSPDRSVETDDACEESSQELSEGNEDMPASESENDSVVEGDDYRSESSSSDNQTIAWTRNEDKIILKTFQQKRDSGDTFKIIGQLLPKRTISEIRERFQTLMNLLLKHRKNE